MTIATAVIVLLGAMLIQGLFAGYETGFVSVNLLRLRVLADDEGNGKAKRLLKYVRRPDQMLTMLLIGTNIGTVAGTIAISHVVGELGAVLIVTPLFLVFGEILPKSVFRAHPNRLSLALLPVINVSYYVLAPLAAPISWVTQFLFRSTGAPDHHISPFMASREDVRVLVDESAERGAIEPEERRMIHSVINLQATQASEIMEPRIDIVALPDTATRQEVVDLLVTTGRTRIPIYHETIDSITGVVTAHDLLLDTTPENPEIMRFVREIMHVPDSMKVDDLFEAMKREKQHMAIVADEYGGTDGLVTIENILEEIFGDIQDEHDSEENQLHQIGPGAYVVDARMNLEEFSEAVGIKVDDQEVETVGGWVMRIAGRIPQQGEVITHERFRITVLDRGNSYVAKVRCEVLPEPTSDAAS